MEALELIVIDKDKKISLLKLNFSDNLAVDRKLAYYELKNLEALVREAVKILEG